MYPSKTDKPTKFWSSKRESLEIVFTECSKSLFRIQEPTFSLVWPVKVKVQALEDNPFKLVLLRSRSFRVLSVDAETRVSESKKIHIADSFLVAS